MNSGALAVSQLEREKYMIFSMFVHVPTPLLKRILGRTQSALEAIRNEIDAANGDQDNSGDQDGVEDVDPMPTLDNGLARVCPCGGDVLRLTLNH